MSALLFLLSIWLIGALLFFLLFVFGKYHVKITSYKTGDIYFASGWKKVSICFLLAILWPYIVIKNLIKGE